MPELFRRPRPPAAPLRPSRQFAARPGEHAPRPRRRARRRWRCRRDRRRADRRRRHRCASRPARRPHTNGTGAAADLTLAEIRGLSTPEPGSAPSSPEPACRRWPRRSTWAHRNDARARGGGEGEAEISPAWPTPFARALADPADRDRAMLISFDHRWLGALKDRLPDVLTGGIVHERFRRSPCGSALGPARPALDRSRGFGTTSRPAPCARPGSPCVATPTTRPGSTRWSVPGSSRDACSARACGPG